MKRLTLLLLIAAQSAFAAPPNILLILPDQMRASAMGCDGNAEIKTPNIDRLAAEGIRLEGLGGTEGGVIGALAALGLAAEGHDGRIVQIGRYSDRRGLIAVGELQRMGVSVVEESTGQSVLTGFIDLRKKLRPNLRQGQAVLFVERTTNGWVALKRL